MYTTKFLVACAEYSHTMQLLPSIYQTSYCPASVCRTSANNLLQFLKSAWGRKNIKHYQQLISCRNVRRSRPGRFLYAISIVFCVVALFPPRLLAYDLPQVNLGLTSILDGGAPSGPGLYFQQYLQFYDSATLLDGNGDDLVLPTERGTFETHDFAAISGLSQLVYQSDGTLLGGKWGVDVILPAVFDFDLNPRDSLALQPNGAGIGDLLVGPFVQWDPVMGPQGPRFMQRVELEMIFPTGRYDTRHEINPGSNHFSFNPYWAATYFANPRWTISWRVHYLWNATNNDPTARTRGAIQLSNPLLPVDDITPGQAIHVNLTTSYEVIPKQLRLGINGYFLRQITDTEVDGRDLSGRRERVYAVGPAAVYHYSQETHFFLNAYREFGAENRSEGNRLIIRFVHHF